MSENNLNKIPDLNQALSLTQKYEEFKYMRIWGIFLLIDALTLLFPLLLIYVLNINGILGGRFSDFSLRLIFTVFQFFIIIIMIIRISKTQKITRMKFGKIYFSAHRLFIFGIVGIELLSIILLLMGPFEFIKIQIHYFPYYDQLLYDILIWFLYFKLMRKIISTQNFKEVKIFILILLILLIAIFIIATSDIDNYYPGSAIFYVIKFVLSAGDLILGINALKMSKHIINGDYV
ncbi:hypothetical protein [Candidatus Lokiarchaeum ossiferum]|uniref:hypothetical protein n=1 Tax=Candidatus Lokiarchaeum ossiferum TaxID=2951803 RepID=UPI00352CFCEC